MKIRPEFLVVTSVALAACTSASSPPVVTDGGNDAGAVGDDAEAGEATDAASNPDGAMTFGYPEAGAFGCEGTAPLTSASCALTMPLSGGISGTLMGLGAFACGWVSSPAPENRPLGFQVSGNGAGPWFSVSASFTPRAPITPGQPGPLEAVALLLSAHADDGGTAQWSTPYTCTLQLASDTCVSGALAMTGEYAMTGTGHCPDRAQPLTGNPLLGDPSGPVTIGDFSFGVEYGTPSGSGQ